MSRLSELSLFEEFSLRGRWWLPTRKAEPVPGELNFSSDGIRLDIDGKFGVNELQDTAANQRLRAFATLLVLKHLGLDEAMVARALCSHLNLAY